MDTDRTALGEHRCQHYFARPAYLIRQDTTSRSGGDIIPVPDMIPELGLKIELTKIDPATNKFTFQVYTGQRDYIVLKAMEKPLINVLWLGTLVVMLGFGVAVYRRYTEFVKMRDKGLEASE